MISEDISCDGVDCQVRIVCKVKGKGRDKRMKSRKRNQSQGGGEVRITILVALVGERALPRRSCVCIFKRYSVESL